MEFSEALKFLSAEIFMYHTDFLKNVADGVILVLEVDFFGDVTPKEGGCMVLALAVD